MKASDALERVKKINDMVPRLRQISSVADKASDAPVPASLYSTDALNFLEIASEISELTANAATLLTYYSVTLESALEKTELPEDIS